MEKLATTEANVSRPSAYPFLHFLIETSGPSDLQQERQLMSGKPICTNSESPLSGKEPHIKIGVDIIIMAF